MTERLLGSSLVGPHVLVFGPCILKVFFLARLHGQTTTCSRNKPNNTRSAVGLHLGKNSRKRPKRTNANTPKVSIRCYQGIPSGEHEGSPCKRPSARFFEPMMLPQRCHKGKPCRLRPCKARARDTLPDLFGLFGLFEKLTGTRKRLSGTHLSPRKVLRRSLGTFSSRPPHKVPVAVLPSAHAQQCGTFQTGDGKQRITTKAATTDKTEDLLK